MRFTDRLSMTQRLRLLIWLVLIAAWAMAATRVLRPALGEPPAAARPDRAG